MIHDEFVKLVDSLPEWERDELRRFLERGHLDREDDIRTLALIKQSVGTDLGIKDLIAVPVSASDLATLTAGPSSYFLAGIETMNGCNALGHGSKLPVDPGPGLQIYSGRNGAGKSSFVRLLRAAGNARLGIEVLPDVFAAGSVQRLATANFDVYVDGELQRISWQQGIGADAPLAIAVYDRDCSAVYLEGGNVAEYLPHGLDAFAVLADARKRLKLALLEEATALREKMPSVSEDVECDTQVRQVLEGWDDLDTAKGRLAALAKWGPEDDARLNVLEDSGKQVGDARAAYLKLAETIEKTRACAKALNDASSTLDQVGKAFGSSLTGDLAAAREAVEGTRSKLDAAKARVAQGTTMNSVLSGTATAEWIALVQAAKDYSEAHAYLGSTFPATDFGCVCVLCQQALEPSAADRLKTFAATLASASSADSGDDPEVRGLARQLAELESGRSSALRVLDDAASRVRQLLQVSAIKANPEAIRCLSALIPVMESTTDLARLDRLEQTCADEIPPLIDCAVGVIDSGAVAAWSEVSTLEGKSADAPESFEQDELNELRARVWLGSNLVAMQRRVVVLRMAEALEGAAGELSITPLTNLSKRVAAELVTDRLIGELRSQLAQVGLGYLQAQVVSSGRAGVTTIRLAPPDKGFRKTDMSRVLSEGEQALMGLAAFLAELELAGHSGPVVLDDPVTGLDTENKDLMAERLASLGSTRQVLVMTHDQEFVQSMRDASERHGAKIVVRSVSRQGDQVGVVE